MMLTDNQASQRPRFTESEYLMILGERELRIEERERAVATLQEMLRGAREEADGLRRENEELRTRASIPPDPLSPTAGKGGDHEGIDWAGIVRDRMAEYSTVTHAGSPGPCV